MVNRQFGMLLGLSVLGIMALLLSACSAGGGDAASASLAGSSWRLAQIDGVALDPAVEATLIFEEASIGGSNGCNSYGGSYSLSGDRITFSEVFSTMMFCEGPGGEVETAFMGVLNGSAQFELAGTQLTLRGENGTTLVFTAQ